LFTIGSQIAAFGFAISATVQEFLGSCIFLFIKHPYDVGDRVFITDTHLIVEHISLLYTSFKRVDNNRVVQISNIINNNNWIENVTRSKAMKEQVSVVVHAETSFADIEVLRGEIEAFVLAADNKRDFFPEVEIQIMEVKDLKSIELLVGVQHKVRNFYLEHFSLANILQVQLGQRSSPTGSAEQVDDCCFVNSSHSTNFPSRR
jgi:small-conductance mechanosensitive channel